jgi:hypothetical protein
MSLARLVLRTPSCVLPGPLYSVTAGAGDSAIGASRHIAGFWAKADADAQRRRATQAAPRVFTLKEECPHARSALQSHERGIFASG